VSSIRPDEVALVALTTRALPSDVRPLSSREVWPLLEGGRIDGLLSRNAEALTTVPKTAPDVINRAMFLLDRLTQTGALLQEWAEQGIWTVTAPTDEYPAALKRRLGPQAPVVLHGVGDRGQLASEGIGVVGSRNLSESGFKVARAAGRLAAAEGLVLVSGGARGADVAAMDAAVDAGGHSTAVLADSLRRAGRDSRARELIYDGRVCLVTPYHPDVSFTAGNAMGRNKIIYGLSNAVLVVASDQDRGGTWSGAVEALKTRSTRVCVWRGDGEGEGNAVLVKRGGEPVSDVAELTDEGSKESSHDEHEQLRLDL